MSPEQREAMTAKWKHVYLKMMKDIRDEGARPLKPMEKTVFPEEYFSPFYAPPVEVASPPSSQTIIARKSSKATWYESLEDFLGTPK